MDVLHMSRPRSCADGRPSPAARRRRRRSMLESGRRMGAHILRLVRPREAPSSTSPSAAPISLATLLAHRSVLRLVRRTAPLAVPLPHHSEPRDQLGPLPWHREPQAACGDVDLHQLGPLPRPREPQAAGADVALHHLHALGPVGSSCARKVLRAPLLADQRPQLLVRRTACSAAISACETVGDASRAAPSEQPIAGPLQALLSHLKKSILAKMPYETVSSAAGSINSQEQEIVVAAHVRACAQGLPDAVHDAFLAAVEDLVRDIFDTARKEKVAIGIELTPVWHELPSEATHPWEQKYEAERDAYNSALSAYLNGVGEEPKHPNPPFFGWLQQAMASEWRRRRGL